MQQQHQRPALAPIQQQPMRQLAGGTAAATARQPGQKAATARRGHDASDSAGGDVVAGLNRVAREARGRMLARIRSHHHAQPSWSWVCRATLRVLQEYSMGTTAGILDSELQMQWSAASGAARGRRVSKRA